MKKIKELKNDLGEKYYELFHDEEKNYLYANWIGFAVDEDIISGGECLMGWLEENADKKCRGYINDNREYKGTWGSTAQWATEVWTPTVYRLGLRYCALVVGEDIFAQMSTESFDEASVSIGLIETRVFDAVEAADRWLESEMGVSAG